MRHNLECNSTLLISFIVYFLIFSNKINAQSNTDRFINASIGIGLSSADDESNVTDSGFYIQGEYVHVVSKWFDFRPYIGFVTTQKEDSKTKNPENYEASTTIFLLGGKSRVTIPIPYISPYFEFGLGASIGKFKTITEFSNIEKNGLQIHFPFALGLELGKKHNIDISFIYYFHDGAKQTSGAAAFGVSFPLAN